MSETGRFALVALVALSLVSYASPAMGAPTPISSCITITAPGSYVLTQNLSSTTDCLVIATNNVSIDLAGFMISAASCFPELCFNLGSGIRDQENLSIRQQNVAIRNGTISGFGNAGILLGVTDTVRVEQLRLVQNGMGVAAGRRTIVKDCIVTNNTRGGLDLGGESVVTGNSVTHNGGVGILTRGDSVVSGNTASFNNGHGISTGSTDLVTGNTASHNQEVGISGRDTLIANNAAFFNDRGGIAGSCPSNLFGNAAGYNGRGFGGPDEINTAGIGCSRGHNTPSP